MERALVALVIACAIGLLLMGITGIAVALITLFGDNPFTAILAVVGLFLIGSVSWILAGGDE